MYIKVKVLAGMKREEFEKVKENEFKINVKEKAENNLANKRIMLLIANHFGVNLNKISIISGHHSPSKILTVRD